MNVDRPASGLADTLKRLNYDGRYGLGLLALAALLFAIEFAGVWARQWLNYERTAIADGQWWRLLTANVVHFDFEHTVLNLLSFVLMWALFVRDYTPWRWLAIYSCASLAVCVGLWFFTPEITWYVGASGALHGVLAAGTLAHLRRGDLDGPVLVIVLIAKLGYEQLVGPMPYSDPTTTAMDAHLFGMIGGLAPALFLKSRREPL
jgi:rhomboid family GlyGly-CTERM serine protease